MQLEKSMRKLVVSQQKLIASQKHIAKLKPLVSYYVDAVNKQTNLSGELLKFSFVVNWFILFAMFLGEVPLDDITFLFEFWLDKDSKRLIVCCTKGMIA